MNRISTRAVAAAAMLGIATPALAQSQIRQQHLQFSRHELLMNTRPMSQAYLKVLDGERAPRAALELRIERVFAKVVQHAVRLHPAAEYVDWKLVLVQHDAVPPFAMRDGQVFIPTRWVKARRLTDAELGLLVAHEIAHVLADHMLERISAFAAARPAANMRVSDVLRMVDEEWHLARELEPLMHEQEMEADRLGLAIACAAGISRLRALTLFDKMALAERKLGSGYLNSHPDPMARKFSLLDSMHARSLGCPD